jgi:calcineurin-like phosphoesterase family protein
MINFNLKFNREADRNNHFFVSDLHYGHDRNFIWGAPDRGYKNLTEMNQDIIHSWNSHVSATDVVWHLGDTIFKDHEGDKVLNLYNRLNFGTLYEIWGNHRSGTKQVYLDLCNKHGLVNQEQYPMELEITPTKKVIFLGHYAEIQVDKKDIVLAHYPIESWNGVGKKAWHLHGHSHCNLPNTKNLKRLDVGWDFKRKPLSFPEVRDEMKNLNGLPDDHH